MSATKLIGKKQKIRNIILSSGSISRQKLVDASGCNERSVIRYAGELLRQKLIREHYQSGQRGRPSVIYTSNSENIYFLGVSVLPQRIVLAAVDINSFPLLLHHSEFGGNSRGADLLMQIFSNIDLVINKLKDQSLYAICVSSHCEQTLSNNSWVTSFTSAAHRRYQAPVEIHDNDALQLQRWAFKQQLSGRIGGMYYGSEFWFVLIDNDEITDGIEPYQRKIRHMKATEKSSVDCFCGKSGCLGAVLSYSGINKRYALLKRHSDNGISAMVNYNNLVLNARNGEAAAQQIIRENGEILGRVGARLKRTFNLDHMVLMHAPPEIGAHASEIFRQNNQGDNSPLLIYNGSYADAIFAAAELPQRRLLNFNLNPFTQGEK